MQMDVTEMGGGLVVLPLESRMDATNSPDFKERILEWVRGGRKRIVLDLSRVTFIDSSGLSAILSCLKAIGQEGDLVICCVADGLMSLFQLTRMTRIFRFYPNVKEAVAAIEGL